MKERRAELERRLDEARADLDRAQALLADADANLARLAGEAATLSEAVAGNETIEAPLRAAPRRGGSRGRGERRRPRRGPEGRRRSSARAAPPPSAPRATRRRAPRGSRPSSGACSARSRGSRARRRGSPISTPRAPWSTEASAVFAASEVKARAAREAHAAAREAQERDRAPLAAAEREAQRLETEARTLRKLVAPADTKFPPILDQVTAEKGYETALGAAFGEDLEASTDASAPAHWALIEPGGDAPLPEAVLKLADFVKAPPALRRRLDQIGVVDKEQGEALSARLRPGQILVSRKGDVWRWDGFTAAADAPSAVARRLVERNRLGELEAEGEAAREKLAALRAEAERLAGNVKQAAPRKRAPSRR